METKKKYGKSYFETFDKLWAGGADLETQISVLTDEVGRQANQFGVGRFVLRFMAPKSVLDPNGQDETFEIYCCPDGYEADACLTEHVQMDENCSAVFEFYPKKGQKWIEPLEESLRFLAKLSFLLLERSKLVQLMEKIKISDLLTGAANTRGFLQFGSARYAEGTLSAYTGMFLNIKNFNYINQNVGARQGDKVLRRYVELVRQELNADELISRLGGDNFMVLVKSEHAEKLLHHLNGLQITMENDGEIATFDLRARVGLCDIQKGQTIGEVMDAISAAVHQAKSSGKRDIVWFDPKIMEETLRQKEVSLLFPMALENREFVVYYQPKVTLENNELCGCEALVRWIRNGKVVPPMQFIPVLEQEGSVCRLDFYVLEQVCRDVRRWLSKGIEPVRISTNFSKVHLYNPNLAAQILEILHRYEIPSKYIEVELTEMSGYENYETLLQFVQTMRENGVSTSIDDFGTGYSSLNLLKDLNVDVIKLDKSFLNNMEKNKEKESDVVVIRNIVHMVNELNMEVIAEGVETKKQAEFLRGIHCRMAQGYLFDKPLPHDDFERRLDGNRAYTITDA